MITIFNGRKRSFGEVSEEIWAQIDVDMRKHIHLFKNYNDLNAWAVFTAIALHADADGWAFPGYPLLETETGLGEDALTRAIKHLRIIVIDGHKVFSHYRTKNRSSNQWGKSFYRIFPEASSELTGYPDLHPSFDLIQIVDELDSPPPLVPGVAVPGLALTGYKDNQDLSITNITDPDGPDNKLVPPVKRNRPNPGALSHLNGINLPITNEREKSKSEPLTGLETYLEGIYGRSFAGFTNYRARLKDMVGTEKSPHDLWESDPEFRKWVSYRCDFYRQKSDTNIVFLINLICKYDGQYGWLLAKEKSAPVADDHVWGSEPLDAKSQAILDEILRKQNESNT